MLWKSFGNVFHVKDTLSHDFVDLTIIDHRDIEKVIRDLCSQVNVDPKNGAQKGLVDGKSGVARPPGAKKPAGP